MKDARWSMIWRLVRYAKPYSGRLILVNVLSQLSSLIFIGYFVIFKSLIDGGIIAKEIAIIRRDLLLLLALAVLREGAAYCANWIKISLQEKINKDVQMEVFSRILNLPLLVSQRMSSGTLINKVIVESGTIPGLLTQWSVEILREPVKVAGLLGFLFYCDRSLTCFVILVVVPIVLLNRFLAKKLDALYEIYYERKSAILSRLEEVLLALPVVKAFVREHAEEKRFNDLLASSVKTDLKLAQLSLLSSPLNELTKIATLSLIVLFGSYAVKGGSVSAGTLVLYIGSTVTLFESISGLSYLYSGLRNSLVGARRVFALIDTPEEEEMGSGGDMPLGLHGDLELKGVGFTYEGRELVLREADLLLKDGNFIAIVGDSGSGKTTLALLLMRFYLQQQGMFSLGGTPVSRYGVCDWRRKSGIVFQDTLIFSGTIYDNIAYARPDVQAEDVYAVARAADIHSFIISLKDGYQTAVGERGIGLSGGQRQRLAIARALLIDPDLLLLDEATSFVDIESEERILSELKTLRKGKKTLMMTHRASSLKYADKVCKLERGRIEPYNVE